MTLTIVLVFGVAFLTGAVATWASRQLALRLGIVCTPNPLVASHVRPVAYLGGIGVAVGAAAGLGVTAMSGWPRPSAAFLACAAMFLLVGLADDVLVFTPGMKLSLQCVVAAGAAVFGVRADVTGIAAVDVLISVLWIVTVVNAVNMTDVCDGLVAGSAVPVFLALALLAHDNLAMGIAAAGACCGFVVFNLPPASIFLGDAGTHLIGFVIAALAIARRSESFPIQTISAILVAGLFLFELVFITTVRIVNRRPFWKGSRDHFALRLQRAGVSRARIDVGAWMIGGAMGAAAIGFARWPLIPRVAIVSLVILAAAAAWRGLLRLGVD